MLQFRVAAARLKGGILKIAGRRQAFCGRNAPAAVAAVALAADRVEQLLALCARVWRRGFVFTAGEKTGAAKLLDQKNSSPEKVIATLVELVENEATRLQMRAALAQWHAPKSAEQIAEAILNTIGQGAPRSVQGAGQTSAGREINLKAIA